MSFTFMSAPMEDISDNAFRTLCHKYGADITFTEMVRIEALARKNASTWSRLEFYDGTPTIIQLLGADEYYLKKFLSMFKPHDGFQGFNLNLGCPSPHVVKLGQGCAMIKRIAKTQKLVNIIKKKYNDMDYSNCNSKNAKECTVSIKIRLGLNKFEKEKKVYLNLIKAVNADFFVVHARYGSQTYLDKPDYSVFPECIEAADKSGKTIIANGDIDTKEKIEELRNMGVKGVMIGRAAVHNPAIFNVLKGISVPNIAQLKEDYLKLAEQFNAPFKYKKNVLKHIGNKKIIAIIDG
ncbi:tRNA-dihydrouridine synthase family protein [Candidatus Woesearchaeota archaeon]|nr:tRNA-dihydrouridine synthase family protein [Candidatus Woesearchaeota archaeon]